MSDRQSRMTLLVAAILLVGLINSGSASAEPALTVPQHLLSSAVHCEGKLSRTRPAPVLLLPGTGSDGSYLFPTGIQRDLSARGVPSCYLDVPGHLTGDMQISTEYVVSAIRTMAKRAGRPIAVFGFSQGGVLARMALTFWPSTGPLVGDVVAASAPQHGSTNLPADFCPKVGCPAAIWQRRPSSLLLGVLNQGDETPGPTAWTTLRTLNDPTALPVTGPHPTSSLIGASNLVVQSICPGRKVQHPGMVFDEAVFAVLVDAITHAGPAHRARLLRGHPCAKVFVGDVTPRKRGLQITALNSRIVKNILAAPRVPEEPPVTLQPAGP